MSSIEIIAVLVNVLGVWLTARRIRWCWPVGVVAVLLYAWLFHQWKLYSDMLLQCVYAVLQGYGWWQWSRGRLADGRIAPTALPRPEMLASLAAGTLGASVLGAVMHAWTDAALPWVDATLTAFSLVASFWAARKRIASWTLWIVLDSAYVALFAYKALPLTATLYAGFVGLAVYGLRSWRAERRAAAGAA